MDSFIREFGGMSTKSTKEQLRDKLNEMQDLVAEAAESGSSKTISPKMFRGEIVVEEMKEIEGEPQSLLALLLLIEPRLCWNR